MSMRINRRQFLTGTAAVGISITMPKGAFAQDGKVNFYNWDTYIGENTIEEFESATGIKVQYDLYADNDELFAKLKGGNPNPQCQEHRCGVYGPKLRPRSEIQSAVHVGNYRYWLS